MRLNDSLDCVARLPQPKDLSGFQKDIDPEWVEVHSKRQELQRSGSDVFRQRR
jgi:hypothetical protein